MSTSSSSGRGRRDPDPRTEFSVPQPKRVCSGVAKAVKVVDAASAIERVLDRRSSWRPIDPDTMSPKHSLQERLVNMTLMPEPATARDADDDHRSSPRHKSSDSTASSCTESIQRRSASTLAVIHPPAIDDEAEAMLRCCSSTS
ncbi:hypothetical protein AaE_012093 [Aphanomyces astaci]|uniref:Uncharacterized protein n=1 Tax=Aphanomyces astaci TaxID=112090 RepID=A0A6A4ZJA9_APHAT|nr:hypothetical protein AaE_012093 [Aphanomyces astaci]